MAEAIIQPQSTTNGSRTVEPQVAGWDISLGIFTVVALILSLWGSCWFKNYHSRQPPQRFTVIFENVAGLNENAAVFVDGVHVGAVESMKWQDEHQVLVLLRINTAILKIPVGAKFEILTNGIVGAKYVQVDMPKHSPGSQELQALDEQSIVLGERPVRPELAVNKLAITLSDIDMKQVGRDFKADRIRLIRAADQLAILADKSMPLVDRAAPLANDLDGLAKDMRRTSRKMAEMFDNPNFSNDLKETARQANETAKNIRQAIHELNETLSDGPLRADLLQGFQHLNQSTANIEASLDKLEQISQNTGLRSDLKDILREAHSTLNTVNEITSKPMGADVRGTLHKTNEAITHLDLAARQMNQILSKRSPLMHLVFGRPGHIKSKDDSPTLLLKKSTLAPDSNDSLPEK